MSVSRSVVYFAYLGDAATEMALIARRLDFMERQLDWLSELIGALDDPINVMVPYVAPLAWDATVERAITRHGFMVDPASLGSDRRNRFEYPGFRALKRLAQASAPDNLIYYCHSKGIVQLAQSKMGLFRWHTHVGLTADLDRLAREPKLTRAGIFPFRFGWCWYNFFWIKAGCMAALQVDEHADRYRFEELIGDRSDQTAYQRVLPLIDRLPLAETGIVAKPWYRAEETSSPALTATYDCYARMGSVPRPAPRPRVMMDRCAMTDAR